MSDVEPAAVPPPSAAVEPAPPAALVAPEPAGLALPSPIPAHLAAAVDAARRRSRSDETWRAYRREWRRFASWCHYYKYVPLQTTPAHVAAYLAKLEGAGDSWTVITQARAAITAAFEAASLPPPTWDPLVRMTMKGLSRARRGTKVTKKAAATVDILERLIAKVDRATLKGKRDAAILLVGQIGAFRRSALARIDCADLVAHPQGYALRVPYDKTDQEGKEDRLKVLPRRDGSPLCPVAAIDDWQKASGVTDGALFRAMRSGCVNQNGMRGAAIANMVKIYARAAGLNVIEFSGHSLRAGMINDAIHAGIPLERIQQQTFHRSYDVLLGYKRTLDPFDGNAATELASVKEKKPQ